jgi:hypothetical protein
LPYESASNESCSALTVGDVRRCVPGDFAYDYNVYRDATCSSRVAYSVGADECAPARYATRFSASSSGCGSTAELWDVIEEVPAADVHLGTPAMCTAIGESGFRFWRVGTASTDVLSELVPEVVGADRLRNGVLATTQGTPVIGDDERIFDTQLGIQCSPSKTATGRRCTPNFYASYDGPSQVWADDQCSVLLAPAYNEACSVRPTHFVDNDGDMCEPTFSNFRPVGAEHTGALYQGPGGAESCATITAEPLAKYYLVSATAVPETDFVEMLEEQQ